MSGSAADNVVDITPLLTEVGENFRFDPDDILENAKGQNFTRLAILAQTEEGGVYISGSANFGEIMILMELAKHKILFEAE